jgi:hypothetical protein
LLTIPVDFRQHATVVTSTAEWVLLAYRVPRLPSTPRIAIWRRLKKLGVAQIGDGLVALPADARTVEALEWMADDVLDAGGTATVWRAQPMSRAAEREVVGTIAAARAAEYAALTTRAEAALRATDDQTVAAEGMRRLRLLRRELRQIQRRDFFPPPERAGAQAALGALADRLHGPRGMETAGSPEVLR